MNYVYELFRNSYKGCMVRNITVVNNDFSPVEPRWSWLCPAGGAVVEIQQEKTGEEDQRGEDTAVIAWVYKLLSLRDDIELFSRPKSFDLPKNWKVDR